MKKIVVLLVAAALLATPAFAVVRNSKHDLSQTSAASIKSNNTDETCVFCHTPHGGVTGILAPLWNRSIPGGGFTTAQLYNSATLDAQSRPTQVLSAVNNSDAPLCMTCHDGRSLAGGLINPPNSTGQPTFTGTDTVTGQMNLKDAYAADTYLTNDHPIGMDYSAVFGNVAGEFRTSTGTYPNEVVPTTTDDLPLYTNVGVMWCSTCHDVHNQSGYSPFLNADNTGSALCTACHIK